MSFFSWWRSKIATRRSTDSAMLAMVLNNMTQGVVMFDSAERVVVCNDRYLEMYGLSPDIVKPGASLTDVIENRMASGSIKIDPQAYRAEILSSVQQGGSSSRIVETPDGRAVSVVNRAIEHGRFWVGTHDDITERIRAERKNAALSEQERRRIAIESEIRTFREGVASVLNSVSESTKALKSIAGNLSNSSGRTA